MNLWWVLALSSGWMAAVSAWCGAVRYPAYRTVPDGWWGQFHQWHCFWISWLVIPGMGIQAASTLALVGLAPTSGWAWVATLGTAVTLGQTCWFRGRFTAAFPPAARASW